MLKCTKEEEEIENYYRISEDEEISENSYHIQIHC